MARRIILTVLAALLAAGPVQARLVKEMQVTRTGKIGIAQDGPVTVYQLQLENNKLVVIGDREFFPPATRAALEQALERKLTVEIAGHLLIFNDQNPVFALPLGRLEVKGLDAGPRAPQPQAQTESQGDAARFQEAALKSPAIPGLGKVLESYPFFSARSWKVLEPGKAEFRGEIDLTSITELDSQYVSRLRSKDLRDTFKSLAFVAVCSLRPDGGVDCPAPAVEAVLQDGTKDRLVWKDPPGYYWDRIAKNRKIKVDYFLSKAALNPKYGKGMTPEAQ
ncbi:hypothetical protein NNJEOMEG_00910 [Fundidesulfovibrio magnetotacticus]|uniref:DUF4412 domain-containing protein n=1 Tax=Fundidesulfovibrio magnetotacticus TaxID=2730080 RepID=A0A6V8LR97_9BACT|nr:hypothetical protein [Fundidesulfovibrio magnetotacticus]GFK93081.1 hypothetical protein NNJEOMEG_00910 [Fundidesulfovibrio magnetotacticus]